MAQERREWLPQVVDEPTNRRYFRVLPFPLADPICTHFSKQPANGRKSSANLASSSWGWKRHAPVG